MKTNTLILLLSVLFLMPGCSESNEPEEQIPPIITSSNNLAIFEDNQEFSRLTITGGNGDYRIIYPKKVTIYPYRKPDEEVDFTENMVTVKIENGNIVVAKRTHPDEPINMEGFFMIVDAKNAKRVFRLICVSQNFPLGMPDPVALGMYMKELANDPDYWMEYPD